MALPIYSNEWIREVINDSYARMRDKTALPLITKSRQAGMTSIMDMLREKQDEADLAARQQGDWKWPKYENGVYVAIDPAKPGSDVTSIRRVTSEPLLCRPLTECPIEVIDTAYGLDLQIKPPAPPAPSFDVDRAWDMLVLAARTSRYGG